VQGALSRFEGLHEVGAAILGRRASGVPSRCFAFHYVRSEAAPRKARATKSGAGQAPGPGTPRKPIDSAGPVSLYAAHRRRRHRGTAPTPLSESRVFLPDLGRDKKPFLEGAAPSGADRIEKVFDRVLTRKAGELKSGSSRRHRGTRLWRRHFLEQAEALIRVSGSVCLFQVHPPSLGRWHVL
jgi:hypothetical protein